MKPIRVVQVVAGLDIGAQSGGAELFGAQIARELRKLHCETAVFPLWEFGTQVEQNWCNALENDGIPVGKPTTPGRSRLLKIRQVVAELWSFVSRIQPEIVNSHSQQADAIVAMLPLMHPCHPKSVRTVHIDQPWLNRLPMDILFDKILFPALFAAELAVSKKIRSSLDRRLVARILRKKSHLCYNGIDAALLQDSQSIPVAASLSDGVLASTPKLGVVGRLTKQKGHKVLFQALRAVCATHSVSLVIIGTGPDESKLRALAGSLGLQKNIHFLGSRADVPALMRQLDILVSPSLWEGLPTVLLEAMALGIPVVATDVSGSREIVRNGSTGTLVPPGDPVALARAIVSTLENRELSLRMAANAKGVAARHTVQEAARTYQVVYRQVRDSQTGCQRPDVA